VNILYVQPPSLNLNIGDLKIERLRSTVTWFHKVTNAAREHSLRNTINTGFSATAPTLLLINTIHCRVR